MSEESKSNITNESVLASSSPSTSSSITLDAILLTASNPSQAEAFRHEVEIRRARGMLPSEEKTRVLVACDPAGIRIGSGGATLAALYALKQSLPGSNDAEKMKLLKSMKIGLFHSGGDSQRLPTCSVRGKAFCGLPYYDPTNPTVCEATPLDFLFECLSRICQAPGCIITATDCLFDFPLDYPQVLPNTPESQNVVGCTVETDAELGSHHGVFVVPGDRNTRGIRPIQDILQKAGQAQLKAAGAISEHSTVLLDSGIIFMSPNAIEALVNLAEDAPFDTCLANSTTASSSSNTSTKAFRFELYTDILLPTNPALDLNAYYASTPPDPSYPADALQAARLKLWTALHPFTCYGAVHPSAKFFHMGTMHERMDYMFSPEPRYVALRQKHHFQLQTQTFTESEDVSRSGAAILNSIVEPNQFTPSVTLNGQTFIEYSSLSGTLQFAGVIVSGVRSRDISTNLQLCPGRCIQETQLNSSWTAILSPTTHLSSDSKGSTPPTVISVFDLNDSIKLPYSEAKATFLKLPFNQLLQTIATQIEVPIETLIQSIWPQATSNSSRTLWHAKVFPVHLLSASDSSSTSNFGYVRWMFSLQSLTSSEVHQRDWSDWFKAPRMSFSDILAFSDVVAEGVWREKLAQSIDQLQLRRYLLQDTTKQQASHVSTTSVLSPILRREILRIQSGDLATPVFSGPYLDELAQSALTNWSTQGHLLARIWGILGSFCQTVVGTAATTTAVLPKYQPLLKTLAEVNNSMDLHSFQERVLNVLSGHRLALINEAKSHGQLDASLRNQFSQLALLYESASAAVGRCLVARPEDIAYTLSEDSPVPIGSVVEVRGCVRLDLFGGWTDTPPVCYEHGGCVLNVAVQIDGEYPIRLEGGMKVASAQSPVIQIQIGLDNPTMIQLNALSELSDYNQPTAPAALIKCALIAMEIIDLKSPLSLVQQLSQAYYQNGSSSSAIADSSAQLLVHLQLKSWIALKGNVAQGTGLGISSILAADLVQLFARLFNRVYTRTAITFLVLKIEQMLTTCGGWQDQVGGLWDGFKLTRSPRGLPLRIEVEQVDVSAKLIQEFESHCLFIHTGLPRLAKNLLRTVLDAWSTRDVRVVDLFDRLEAGAPKMAAAIQQGAWKEVGEWLSEFWRIKRILATDQQDPSAPPAEPVHVTELMQQTKHLCYGSSLAGAGGGGFLVLFAPPSNHATIATILTQFNTQHPDTQCRLYKGTISTERCFSIDTHPPAAPLVGIELNPGPSESNLPDAAAISLPCSSSSSSPELTPASSSVVSPAALLYRDVLHHIFKFLPLHGFIRACLVHPLWYACGRTMKSRADECFYVKPMDLLVQSPLRFHITRLNLAFRRLPPQLLLIREHMNHLDRLDVFVELTKEEPMPPFVIPTSLQQLCVKFRSPVEIDAGELNFNSYLSECTNHIAAYSTRLFSLEIDLENIVGAVACPSESLQAMSSLTDLQLSHYISLNQQIDLIKSLSSLRRWSSYHFLTPNDIQRLMDGTGPPRLEYLNELDYVDEPMVPQLRRLSNLTELTLRMTLIDPTQLLPYFSRLSILDLTCYNRVNATHLTTALGACVTLTDLTLSMINYDSNLVYEELTNDHLNRFLPNLTSLVKFRLEGYKTLPSMRSLQFLTTLRSNLTDFSIYYCINIPMTEYELYLGAIAHSVQRLTIWDSSAERFAPLAIARMRPGSPHFSRESWPQLQKLMLKHVDQKRSITDRPIGDEFKEEVEASSNEPTS